MEIDTARFPLSHRPAAATFTFLARGTNPVKITANPDLYLNFEMRRSAWPYHHVEAGPMSSGLDSGEYNCKGVDVERYLYRAPDWNGEFRHVATGWEEYQNLARKFTFIEESRAFDSITLLDSTRNIGCGCPSVAARCSFVCARPRRDTGS